MTQRHSFWRKVIYISIMVALLIPMSWLSMPASRSGAGEAQPGGTLAQLRAEYGLGQASLGEIDPASETMKLATLGMRGVAANILWDRAIYYKKTENWTKFQAVLKQIARLQPNFISVWQYQAWNTSYNLSVEFDDYHDRYAWVIRGIEFLQEGLRYNNNEPRLLWDMGWFIGQKIGRADEHVQYRRLFKRDDDFHAGSGRTFEQRDNWLVSKYWFREAINSVDFGKKTMKGKSPLIFRSDPGMAQINYADAIQSEGVHGERAANAWTQAAKDWKAYGDDSILTSYDFRIRLNDQERFQQDADRYRKQLESLEQGLRDKIYAERYATLSAEEQRLAELNAQDVPEDQHDTYFSVRAKLEITPVHLAERIEKEHPDLALEAVRLGRLWYDANRRAETIDRYRTTVNFNYWQARCNFEQQPEALRARELSYRAGLAHEDQDLITARKLFEEAFPLWRKALDAYPLVRDEGLIAEDLVSQIAQYRQVLTDLNINEFPQDFILRDIAEHFDRDKQLEGLFTKPAEKESDAKQGDDSSDSKQPAADTDSDGKTDADGKSDTTEKQERSTAPRPEEKASDAEPANSAGDQSQLETGAPPEPEDDGEIEAAAPSGKSAE